MPSGYRNGLDFDDLFDPYVEGPYAQDTGRRVQGVDLSRRYAHIQYGSKRADVGYRVGGVDVSNLWAAKGTATYVLPFHGKSFSEHNQAVTNSTGMASARIQLRINADGTYEVWEFATGGGHNSSQMAERGTWLRSGSSDLYEVRFEFTDIGAADVSSSAPDWSNASASHSGTAEASVPAASTQFMSASVQVHCYMRRIGSSAGSRSTIVARVGAGGWR